MPVTAGLFIQDLIRLTKHPRSGMLYTPLTSGDMLNLIYAFNTLGQFYFMWRVGVGGIE